MGLLDWLFPPAPTPTRSTTGMPSGLKGGSSGGGAGGSSGGGGGGGGGGSFVIPSSAPAPAPAPQNNGGGRPGMNRDSNGTWVQTDVNAGGPRQPEIDYNAMYAPVLAALDQGANVLRENSASLERDLGTQRAAGLRDIEAEYQTGEKNKDRALEKGEASKQSALQAAVRARNAASQRAMALFGGASSAGNAAMEVSDQEYYRQQGQTEQSYATVLGDITTKWQEALRTFASAKFKLEDTFQMQLNQVKRDLATGLQQIQMSKAQTESEKQARKIASLEQARAQQQQIALMKQQADISLNTWKEQMQYQLQNELKPYANTQYVTQGYVPETAQINPAIAPVQNTPMTYNPNTRKLSYEDDLNKLALPNFA